VLGFELGSKLELRFRQPRALLTARVKATLKRHEIPHTDRIS
jgi:hypothetical protein